MKVLNAETLGINPNDFGEMAKQYLAFLEHNQRSFSPLTINESYLARAHFHQEEGRGGYFAPESGTSEGQFLCIRSLLEIYLVLKETKYLNLAIEMMEATQRILYRGWQMPDTVDEDNLWLPHWLFNASEPFVAEKYYLYEKVKFTKGVGTVTMPYEAREVYTVRALDAQLEWENPYSKIIGKEYKIKSYRLSKNQAVITLAESFTGEAYVTCSDLGGPIIETDECYEAWPIWRKLNDGEVACAVDSLWWAYDCYRLLAICVPDNPFYKRAERFTLDTIVEVMKVSNMNDWHVTEFSGNPFYTMGLYQYQNRYPEANITRDKKDGSAIIDVPKGEGQVQYGKGGIGIKFESHKTVEIKIASNKDVTVTFFIAPRAGATYDERYTAYLKLKGDDVVRKYTLTHDDFIKKTNLIWDYYFLREYAEEEVYHSPKSTVKIETVENSSGREFRQVTLTRKTETDGLYDYLGWAQYQPILHPDNFDFNYIPNFYIYLKSGAVNLRLTDAKGYYWETEVPKTTAFKNFCPNESAFKLSAHQNVTGTPTKINYPLKEMLFDGVDEVSVFRLGHIGEIESVPADTNINDFVFETSNPNAHKIRLFYSRPLPLEGYEYTPYVAPFTVNTVNRHLDTWRGTPYTGYQCPWIWQEIGDEKGVKTVLEFLERAQDEYADLTTFDGFFMPLFIWDRWDSREYGEPNTFSFNGPDPNTHWGGFQYRGIETVARTYYNDPSNEQAKRITLRFLKGVEKVWQTQGSYPTTFPEGKTPCADYREPQMVALLLRACLFYYQTTTVATEEALCLRLIRLCLQELYDLFNSFSELEKWNTDFINGTWSVTNQEWMIFWGGEILSTLALLLSCTTSEFIMKTRYGMMKVETFPEFVELEDFVKVKTPIGIQKVKLVELNEETASPLRIMTEKGVLAVGGVKFMAGLTREVKLLVQNEGYALKPVEVIQESQSLENEAGALKIMNIKGKSMRNYSPRKTYDYGEEGNWANSLPVEGGKWHHLTFDVTTPLDTTLTIVFKDADGADFGWMDIDSMSVAKKIHFGFPTEAKAVSCMIYLQADGACVLDNIMLLKGKYEHGVPDYFEGIQSTCEEGLMIAVRERGSVENYDVIQLTDIVPAEYLPLMANEDGVADEIVGNVLYKRFEADGTLKDVEEVVLLNDFIALLEAPKNCDLILEDVNKMFPDMDIRYPVNFESYIKELIR